MRLLAFGNNSEDEEVVDDMEVEELEDFLEHGT